MFDEYGKIISVTRHFYDAISKNKNTDKQLFDYDQLKKYG